MAAQPRLAQLARLPVTPVMRSKRSPPMLVSNRPQEPVLRITSSFSLKAALNLVDIRVLDHMVVAGSHCLSFAERGLL